MRLDIAIPVLFAMLAVITLVVTGGLVWFAVQAGTTAEENLPKVFFFSAIGALILALIFAAACVILLLRVARPLTALTREIQTLTHSPSNRQVLLEESHFLGQLPTAVQALVQNAWSMRENSNQAIEASISKEKEQRSQLEAILLDLSEGVIVCNLDHRILLYNQAAARILDFPDALGLGQSLFGVLTREPVLHNLEQLIYLDEADRNGVDHTSLRFICAAVEKGILLQASLGSVAKQGQKTSGYVLTFEDVSTELQNLSRRDVLLREVAIDWRRPLANVRAAIETIALDPKMEDDQRKNFENIISSEIEDLSDRLLELTHKYDRLTAGQWPMSDIYSLDLFRAVKIHIQQSTNVNVTPVGVPLWFHADSHSIMLTIEHLIKSVHHEQGTEDFDVEALLSDRYIYIEIAWRGTQIMSHVLDKWLEEILPSSIGGRTAREIVEHHSSEVISKNLPENCACLQIPLRHPKRQQFKERQERLPARPEFYDFDLFHMATGDKFDQTALRKLHIVVFDTETTGLKPSLGDEIISIGAVRIVNGRILTGETFERLINPGRDIPDSSIRFHGITENMVRDKPPSSIVLPQFKGFVGQSVLVAYNAAFDMKFLKLQEDKTGTVFDNPVLDVLLLSAFLHDHAMDHSLDATAERFGVEISNRHSALGDAMATAAIFVRMLDLLNTRGVRTFGDAINISQQMDNIRKRQAQF